MNDLPDRIFTVTPSSFNNIALRVFGFQYQQVEIYRQFCDSLKRSPEIVKQVDDIPFLPISFFKTHPVVIPQTPVLKTFESSGTTGQVTSKHMLTDLAFYETSFLNGFNRFYGNPGDYVILALLPSYLERDNSSLVYMTQRLIEKSGQNASGFFLNDFEKLYDWLDVLKNSNRKVILLGVTFALLDFADKYKIDFPELIVMETGGMKGRREELTRAEVHQRLCTGFGVSHIHSEYGMTELLSQAYSKEWGLFNTPPWMKILIRDIYDPLMLQNEGVAGAINVIDLANLYSCSFIATDDLGRILPNGSFEVIGRMDSAEVRGCNLMVV